MVASILEMKHICKTFSSTVALDDVTLEAFGGEVRGLIGENGSGKSTISSIAAGMQKADSGEMLFQVRSWAPASMIDALEHGVGMIVQESGIIAGISMAENLFLGETGQFRTGRGAVDRKAMNQKADIGIRNVRGAKENGVAAAIKHFPGDGVDERDQHILTSVNSLSREAWDASFGRIYRALIEQGAETVMVGHIALPAYADESEKYLPASLSKSLMTGLLRNKLGFNGLISTDATPMVGFTAAMPRAKAIPAAIAAGADMILFNKDLDEDYRFLLDGIKSGVLTVERLDEAVTRILATKAALRLHEKQKRGTLVPAEDARSVVGCEKHRAWAAEVADRAVTLVKDTQDLLPLSPEKYPRVYLNIIQKDMSPDSPVVQSWKALFEQEGFAVTVRDRRVNITVQDMGDIPNMSEEKKALMHEMYRAVSEVHDAYDLYVYIVNMENASNNTTLRLNWNVAFGLGDDAPWFVSEIPAPMISTAHPYHLFDAPMLKTYINAYAGTPDFQRAVMEKLMGRSRFTGKNPIDPFCGKDYLK